MNNKDITDQIVMTSVIIFGCILIRFGLNGSVASIIIGIIFVTGGIMAQVTLVLVPLFKAIRDRIKEKKAEKEEDSVGPGIK